MKLLAFILIGCLTVLRVSADKKNKLNDLVDEVIWEMEQDMIKENKTIISLPDIDQSFTKKILFFNVNGEFKLSGATVQNLSTIYRVGDITPTQDETTGSMTFPGTFAMKDLTLKADLLDLKVGFIHIHDPLTVTVAKNAATFAVTLIYDENLNCQAKLKTASVSQLGNFKISLGTSFLSSIENDIANFVMDKLSSTIQDAINAHIFPIVNKSIDKLDLCNKLM